MTVNAFSAVGDKTKVSLVKPLYWKYRFAEIVPPNYDHLLKTHYISPECLKMYGYETQEEMYAADKAKYDAMQKYSVEYKEKFSDGGKYRVESLRYWCGYDNELHETVSRCTVQVEYTDDRQRGWTGAATQLWLDAYLIKTDTVTGEIVDEWGCSKSHMLKDLFNHLPNAPTIEVDAE